MRRRLKSKADELTPIILAITTFKADLLKFLLRQWLTDANALGVDFKATQDRVPPEGDAQTILPPVYPLSFKVKPKRKNGL